MNLIAASKIATNEANRARAEAAIRREGQARLGADGAPGTLARAAYTDPSTVVTPFLTALSTNGDATDEACEGCGRTAIPDDTLIGIIGYVWDQVARDLYPSAPTS